MTGIGCTSCGKVTALHVDPTCNCDARFQWLDGAAEKLAFRLRFTGRPDDAVTVEDRHAVMREHHPC